MIIKTVLVTYEEGELFMWKQKKRNWQWQTSELDGVPIASGTGRTRRVAERRARRALRCSLGLRIIYRS